MLRISEIKLPLDHVESAIESAILTKLNIAKDELISFSIFKRSYDARKKGAILLVYIVDVETVNEEKLLEKFDNNPHIISISSTLL